MKKVKVDVNDFIKEFDWNGYQKEVVEKQVKNWGNKDAAIVNLEGRVADLQATCDGKQMVIDELKDFLSFVIETFNKVQKKSEIKVVSDLLEKKIKENF